VASPSKAKGDRAELAFVKHIAPWFPNARRGKAGAEADLGDIFGVRDRDGDDWTIQIADRAVMLREHGAVIRKAAEAAEQSERAGTPFWCLVVKRAGCADVGQWFVWLPAWALRDAVLTPFRGGPNAYATPDDLACVTVRTWLALIAPPAAWTPEPPF
jgi:hypothetical protein